MSYLTRKEYALFRSLESQIATDAWRASRKYQPDYSSAREKAREILGYAPPPLSTE